MGYAPGGKGYRVVIFDFDGTLADSFPSFLVVLNKLAAEYHFKAVSREEIDTLRDKNSREVLRALEIPIYKLPIILARAKQELTSRIPGIEMTPGTREVLLELHKEEVQLGLLTSNSLENVTSFLANNALDLFAFTSTSSGLWGKARRLRKILAERGLAAGQVLYVGDETRDIEISRKIGVDVAAVTWGYNNKKALEQFSPDYLITTPQELVSICIPGKSLHRDGTA